MNPYLYLVLIFSELLFLISFTVYTVFLIYSALKGSPYVSTHTHLIRTFLKAAQLKKGMKMLEIGCGDGRVLRIAAKEFRVTGLGIDINPIVIWKAKIAMKLQRIQSVKFACKNLHTTTLKGYDIIYLFLMPKLLTDLRTRLKKETKKNCLIISHGFAIEGWKKYLIKIVIGKPFYTFFYRLK